ncbi:LPXTG cell wall anchor domain-containing protein [Facklamia sp. 7083-14-GEN3]|uniref:LPXTG cell wall anchor domain-containing protein n=1 Tax=Facklamia sp. 7083-14-GEN3 TaxID=2973478 RepID=UPI00215CEC2F|nr:LPXTG cell wall anchor domain-containing protein [Facklamia sp. 7083-14-GEN3]MCR8969394.1 LPXTG cell wall anchor domain-containing protein [Facklamia sp. 7083-14-GEN3]
MKQKFSYRKHKVYGLVSVCIGAFLMGGTYSISAVAAELIETESSKELVIEEKMVEDSSQETTVEETTVEETTVEETTVEETTVEETTVEETTVEEPEKLENTTMAINRSVPEMSTFAVQNNEYIVEAGDTFATIKTALANTSINTLRFIETRTLNWDNLSISRDFRVVVDEGAEVTFNAQRPDTSTAFNVVLGQDQTFTVENYGIMNFDNFNRAMWVHERSGQTGSFEILGNPDETAPKSEINVTGNRGYAIAALDKFAGNIEFKDVDITVRADVESVESGLYLGNTSGSGSVLLDNVGLDIETPSNAHTSVPFTSNAKDIVIKDSSVKSTSKSHYNFEITSSAQDIVQNFTIDNSDIDLITPKDANPIRERWGLKFNEDSIGLNTYNTKVNIINNGSISHTNEGFDEKRTVGLSMANTEISLDQGELNIGTLGSQSFNDLTADINKVIFVNSGSKLTINDFDLNSSNLEKIIIDGGSVNIPNNGVEASVPQGTLLQNSNGEDLRLFKVGRNKLIDRNYVINILKEDSNDLDYPYGLDENGLHNDIAFVWAPSVKLEFYLSEAYAKNGINRIDDEVFLPRGEKIDLVDRNIPVLNQPATWWDLEDEQYTEDRPISKDTKVYPDYFPTIVTKDKVVYVGDDLDLKSLLAKVSDFEDDDATLKPVINLVNIDDFDINVPGVYRIDFTVIDSKGNTTTADATVTVLMKWTPINEAPTLEVTDGSITQGDETFKLESLIEKAQDTEDGNLIDEVVITDNDGFDRDIPGKYTATFTVTDKDGASITKTAVVTVKAKNDEPTVPTEPDTPEVPEELKPETPEVPKGQMDEASVLPATGDSGETVVFTGAALSILAGLGLVALGNKKKEKDA